MRRSWNEVRTELTSEARAANDGSVAQPGQHETRTRYQTNVLAESREGAGVARNRTSHTAAGLGLEPGLSLRTGYPHTLPRCGEGQR